MKGASWARGALTGGLVVGAGLSGQACYPGDPTTIEELDVVGTFYDTDYDFSTNGTFAMPDTVLHLCDIPELALRDCVELGRDNDDTILARVVANLVALGYTREDDPQNNPPDVVVLVAALGTENFAAFVSYPWWGGWGWWPGWGFCPGCFGPGWGWFYPWGGAVGGVRYETGTLFIEMIDPDGADLDEMEIPVPWSGALNGPLVGSAEGAEQRLTDGIDQAFAQSSYLRVGG